MRSTRERRLAAQLLVSALDLNSRPVPANLRLFAEGGPDVSDRSEDRGKPVTGTKIVRTPLERRLAASIVVRAAELNGEPVPEDMRRIAEGRE